MASKVVGYFDDHESARRAEEDLIRSGFAREAVRVLDSPYGEGSAPPSQPESLMERLKQTFGFAEETERRQYAAAYQHGGALVAVTVPEERVDTAADILSQHHPTNLDQRMSEWEPSGASSAREVEAVPLAEEQLMVGKRAVRRGEVHIHQRVVEEPVEAEVTLREERVALEQRPADRPVQAGDEAFQERDITITEMGEEPVVRKEARVTSEIAVEKDVKERQEKFRDTVRKTEVDIEREPGSQGRK